MSRINPTPGHYISMPRGATQAEMLDPLSREGVAGIQWRIPWLKLEPVIGAYDLRDVEWNCALAHAHGKKLVVMPEDKTFEPENPMPLYLRDYAFPNRQGGHTGARWLPQVHTRLSALANTIRAQNFPGFGGIAFQETAIGLDDAVEKASGYSAERYEIALLSLSHSCDYLYLNFLRGGQDRLKRVIEEAACAVGGPDVLPNDGPLVQRVYPLFKAAPNRVRQFSSMQFNSFRHQKADGSGLWGLDELVKWARENLRVETLFWNIPWPGMKGHTIEDAYALIAANQDL